MKLTFPLTLAQVSRLLGIDRKTVRAYINRGEVSPSFKLTGKRRHWRFRPADVRRVCACYERTLEYQKARVPGMYRRRLERYRPYE
jgi:predicted site-specific integrase-resolvase